MIAPIEVNMELLQREASRHLAYWLKHGVLCPSVRAATEDMDLPVAAFHKALAHAIVREAVSVARRSDPGINLFHFC
jgi:hypothetical protein